MDEHQQVVLKKFKSGFRIRNLLEQYLLAKLILVPDVSSWNEKLR